MTAFDPTVFKPGDVILLSYPFGQGAGVRKRPALVVSSSAFNQETGELVIAQITSRASASARAGDYNLAEWREAKLPRPALVRAPPGDSGPLFGIAPAGLFERGRLSGSSGSPQSSAGRMTGAGGVYPPFIKWVRAGFGSC